VLFCPFGSFLASSDNLVEDAGCSPERFVDVCVCHDRLQLADSLAAFAYAFTVTMLILVVLEPFMFLSRKRWPRGGSGVAMTVEDRGTIREEIPMWELGRE
jgi:hypothetical protein